MYAQRTSHQGPVASRRDPVLLGATTFWVIENKEIVKMYWSWETMAKYPREMFSSPRLLYWAVHSVVPVIFLAVVPTQVIMNYLEWPLIISAFFVTLTLAVLSKKAWQAGVKRYSGVST
ncbi:MAG: ABC-2 family transporter protein [Candidatus Shapirobacteria bacterium]